MSDKESDIYEPRYLQHEVNYNKRPEDIYDEIDFLYEKYKESEIFYEDYIKKIEKLDLKKIITFLEYFYWKKIKELEPIDNYYLINKSDIEDIFVEMKSKLYLTKGEVVKIESVIKHFDSLTKNFRRNEGYGKLYYNLNDTIKEINSVIDNLKLDNDYDNIKKYFEKICPSKIKNSKQNILDEKCRNINKKLNKMENSVSNFYISLKNYKIKKINKDIKQIDIKLKNKISKLKNDFDELDKEFYKIYNNSLIICKNNTCKVMCSNDIGYCLNHIPKVCEKCDKIIETNSFDKLNNNKKHNIENCCNSCTQEIFFNNYVNEYNYKDIINVIDENDKFYKTKLALSKKTYLDMLKDKEILSDIENPASLQEKEILEFYGYSTDNYNDFSKYKLYNRLTRSKELLDEFGDKLLYMKIKPSFYSYIGKIEFLAFKDFLYKILNIEKTNNIIHRMAAIIDLNI